MKSQLLPTIWLLVFCCAILGCNTTGDGSIPESVIERGEKLVQQQRFDKAVNLLRPYAKKGNPEAQFSVATWLFVEDERDPKNQEALGWVRKAAAQGHQQSLELLANSYRWGHNNLPTNQVMSEMWLNAARDTNRIPECFRYEQTLLSTHR